MPPASGDMFSSLLSSLCWRMAYSKAFPAFPHTPFTYHVLFEMEGSRGARQGGPALSCPVPLQTLNLSVPAASSQATTKTPILEPETSLMPPDPLEALGKLVSSRGRPSTHLRSDSREGTDIQEGTNDPPSPIQSSSHLPPLWCRLQVTNRPPGPSSGLEPSPGAIKTSRKPI